VCVSDLWSVVPSGEYKLSINPFTNPYPTYSHTSLERDNILVHTNNKLWIEETSKTFSIALSQKNNSMIIIIIIIIIMVSHYYLKTRK
jgi:hypothetical protein